MDIGPLIKWKKGGVEWPDRTEISNESLSFKTLWSQWNSLRGEKGLFKRAWESPDGKHTTMYLVVPIIRIKKVLRQIYGDSSTHFGMNLILLGPSSRRRRELVQKIRPMRRSRNLELGQEGRSNKITSLSKELQLT